jgi:hypothetical protein
MSGYKYKCRLSRTNSDVKLKLNIDNVDKLPSKFSLRSKMGRPFDQKTMGSCTSQSICKLFQYHYPEFNPSRLFQYKQELILDGTFPEDSGSTVATAFSCLRKFGVCSEELCPYDLNDLSTTPSTIMYNQALLNRSLLDGIIDQTLNAIKSCIASPEHQNPISLGVLLFSSFEDFEVLKTGKVRNPDYTSEQLLGGHCLTLTGYDDEKRCFEILNSWGQENGDKGYYFFPYEYILNPHLTSDLHTLYKTTHDAISLSIPKQITCMSPNPVAYLSKNNKIHIEVINEKDEKQEHKNNHQHPTIQVVPNHGIQQSIHHQNKPKAPAQPKLNPSNICKEYIKPHKNIHLSSITHYQE